MFIRRWKDRMVVAGVLGVASTVAVAWGIAMWSTWDPHCGVARLAPEGSSVASVRVDQVWQAGSLARMVWNIDEEPAVGSGTGGTVPTSLDPPMVLDARDVDASWGSARRVLVLREEPSRRTEEARGWPCLALYCSVTEGQLDPVTNDYKVDARGGFIVGDSWYERRVLPYMPIWRGLLVDFGVYGAAWLVLLTMPVVARALVRRRRGWCPVCGYDLKGEWKGGCSECGWNRVGAASLATR